MFAIGFDVALRNTHTDATSARPEAPVVDDVDQHAPVRSSRRWAAAHLRALARGTYHLADRVDPVALPRHA